MTRTNEEMRTEGTDEGHGKGGVGWKSTVLLCGVILLAGALLIVLIFHTEPTAERGGATKETAMLVNVTAAESGTFRPHIVATGTIRPAREIVLRPRVEGQVMELADEFVPGGMVEQGELLVRIDPADYRNALSQRENELAQARADLRLEQGRRTLAEEEIELLNETLGGESRALVLREPQLDSARSRVASARTAVEQARLQLDRTTITAPFDAHVLTREVNAGSQVAAGDALARLVGTDAYWVETTVPVSKLRWLSFPGKGDGDGAEVQVRNRGAWPAGVARSGRLYKRIGALDETTRMARVLVVVEDPLALETDSAEVPPLMLGTYVETRIEGRPVADVVRVDREHMRQNDTVWVMEDGALSIRPVRVAVRDAEYAYVSEGLQAGDRIVTGNLTTVEEGAPLRLQGDRPAASTGGNASGGRAGGGS